MSCQRSITTARVVEIVRVGQELRLLSGCWRKGRADCFGVRQREEPELEQLGPLVRAELAMWEPSSHLLQSYG